MAHASPANPLPQLENILVATDFSPISQRAWPYAYVIAKRFGATLHFVHVVGPKVVGALGASYAETDKEEELATRYLSELTGAAPLDHLRHYGVVCRGEVSEVLCQLASKWKADLVVIGTHGRHGFKHLMLGSVAEHIFRHAQCPVLTVGPNVPQEGPTSERFATLMVAIDSCSASAELLKYAIAVARANESTVVLFHAITEQEIESQYGGDCHDASVAINAQLSTLLPSDLRPASVTIAKRGAPAKLILRSAAEMNADLILMGARRGTTLAVHLPRAIAHIVVCEAHCPVMTIGH